MTDEPETAELSNEAQPLSDSGGRGLRILLAEDNRVNRVLAVRILEAAGHEVVCAENGREAFLHRQESEFDLIFMDVQMPEMDGLAATAAIRSWEAGTGKHVPIIALTAHAMKRDQELCLRVGMDGYLSKPLQRQGILDAITRCVPAA